MGTEIGRLGGYGFRGALTAGDGSNQKGGKMGAGYVNLRKRRKRQQRKVGREEEGSSSNRPELAAFVFGVTVRRVASCANKAHAVRTALVVGLPKTLALLRAAGHIRNNSLSIAQELHI